MPSSPACRRSCGPEGSAEMGRERAMARSRITWIRAPRGLIPKAILEVLQARLEKLAPNRPSTVRLAYLLK